MRNGDSKMNIIFIYVTCLSMQVAQSISQGLLEKHLIGCANIFPMTAKYRWEGKIVEENEVAMILKTATISAYNVKGNQ